MILNDEQLFEKDFVKVLGNEATVLIDNVEDNTVFIAKTRLSDMIYDIVKHINKNVCKKDYIMFTTDYRGIRFLNLRDDNSVSGYELNGKQERAINRKLDFWPSSKDYPATGYLIIFRTTELKTLFTVSKGFGSFNKSTIIG